MGEAEVTFLGGADDGLLTEHCTVTHDSTSVAEVVASATHQPGACVDQHFDNAGQQLLTLLILANRPLTRVYLRPSTPPPQRETVGILEQGGTRGWPPACRTPSSCPTGNTPASTAPPSRSPAS